MHPGKRVVTLCMAGCTLTAIPAAGHRFEGWYDDAEHSRKVADESRYAYVPTSPLRHLFAVFRPDTTPLDDKGTANCYIAPQLGTSYSFDATVTGNGRSTTNIRPSGLSGVSARVLWETGTVRGAVIKDAEYRVGAHRFYNRHDRGMPSSGCSTLRGIASGRGISGPWTMTPQPRPKPTNPGPYLWTATSEH